MAKLFSLFVLAFAALAAATQANPKDGVAAAHKPNSEGQMGRPNSPYLQDHDVPERFKGHHALRARDPVPFGVYTCKGPGWANSCYWARNSPGVCYQLPDSKTLAFGPDIGIQCRLYTGKNCDGQGTAGNTVAPGNTNWKNYQQLNGQVPKSYQCKRCGTGNLNCGTAGVGATVRWVDL